MATIAVTDAGFETDVAKSTLPVLVDFWAEWCGPCRQIGPILDKLAGEYAGRLTIAKINIDENPETPSKFGVRGIPTMMLFRGGNLVATKVGALPESKLKEWIDGVLAA